MYVRPTTMTPEGVFSHLCALLATPSRAPSKDNCRQQVFYAMAVELNGLARYEANEVELELGEEEFFAPFTPLFSGMLYPDDYHSQGEFYIGENLEPAAENFMALLWLYAMQNAPQLEHIGPRVRASIAKFLINTTIDGV